MVDWEQMVQRYDEIAARAATRRSRASGSSAPERSRSYNQWVQYAMAQMKDPVHNEVMYCIARINITSSPQHAANVFMRLYGRAIHPFVVPFQPGMYAPEVWDDCVRRMQDYQARAMYWVNNEVEELMNDEYKHYMEEPRDGSTGPQIHCGPALSRKVHKALVAAWDEDAECFGRADGWPSPEDGSDCRLSDDSGTIGLPTNEQAGECDPVHNIGQTDRRQDVIEL